MKLNEHVIAQSTDRWGALDSLGMAEQRGHSVQDACKLFTVIYGRYD